MSKSPFDFDISAKKDKQKRSRKAATGGFETSSRICEHEGCKEHAPFRAPKSPKLLDEYYWFCQKHIREYNNKWNFFQEQGIDDIEDQIARDRAWDRKTRPLDGKAAEARAWERFGFDDPQEVLGDKATRKRDPNEALYRRLTPQERKALEILGLSTIGTKSDIRRTYKSLVKDLHPDRNEGSRADEDRLAEVVWAWDQIKVSRNFSD